MEGLTCQDNSLHFFSASSGKILRFQRQKNHYDGALKKNPAIALEMDQRGRDRQAKRADYRLQSKPEEIKPSTIAVAMDIEAGE